MSVNKTKTINNIALIVTMSLEAEPLIAVLNLKQINNFFDYRLPMTAYQANNNKNITLISPGICPINKIDRIGTQAATLAAWETIRLLNPDIIINAGTAGGFKKHQANIGDVYISTESFKYHNRHIPVEGYEDFQVGNFQCTEAPKLAAAIGLKRGIISTGDSVSADTSDIQRMELNNAHCKEMEAAAIAEIAQLCQIPMFALKVITDFVDVHECTQAQFLKNYQIAIQALTEKIVAALTFIEGKNLAEL
jgi:nucleoside phosphorylase